MAVEYSKRVKAIKTSVAGDILKLTEQPEMISFAGGLPAEETFPKHEIEEAAALTLQQGGEKALQYGLSLGFTPLREQIAARMNKVYQSELTVDNIIITSGSQQGLDMICRMFCDEGSTVIVEKPTYLGAVMAYDLTGVNYVEIDMDDEGMRLDLLEEVLQRDKNVRMIYVIPDFHNPTGKTWSLPRRKAFMELVQRYAIPVVEDNPYGELRFTGDFLPSLQALDTNGLVLSCGTFSKTFAPGMRIGWVAANTDFIAKLESLKLCMDLSTAPFTMRVASTWLANFDYDMHLDSIRQLYKKRCDAMLAALDEMMPEGFTYTRPEGGLFCWVTMPKHMNSLEVLKKCIDEKVAFVPGMVFFTTPGHDNYFRLNYSCSSEETIYEGVKRLTRVLRSMM